ncbi:hypothetical protein GCM10010174_50340 [Kutzneria viridogrisea]|uniref:HTH lysR-type domain-containing protein n=2 Tax=Kutzneria TaxID=43356 RepID=W5WM77_9PSEU|nr:LysR family transcriptional regulator [Kutzneria albida]AHH99274.1 hypothetical protein KALB_5913 [Kutzneria albida DSM 43870]MBA8923172.1 DNA-binding transcriptional LysR family regulator [Kutzneria viridogrisea]
MQLEIRHARVVVTLAEAGSISKAAARLKLPQPSLTAQLRRIEQVTGGELFIRSSTGITPTRLGRRLVPMLAELVAKADAVLAEATSEAATLRFGVAEWTPTTLPAAVQGSMPGREVRTVTLTSAAALAEVIGGQLDLVLVSGPAEVPALGMDAGLATEVVVTEPIWVAVPQESPVSGQSRAHYAELTELPWVRHVPEHWVHEVERWLTAGGGFEPEVLHEVAGHAEAMIWVRDAGTATLVTPSGWSRGAGLVTIDEPLHSELKLVWRPGAVEEETVRTLTAALRSYYADYARTVPGLVSWAREHPGEFPQLEGFAEPG